MPCYDSRDSEDRAEMQRRLDVTTRLACDYCKSIERAGEDIPAFARHWWEKHKIKDAKFGTHVRDFGDD